MNWYTHDTWLQIVKTQNIDRAHLVGLLQLNPRKTSVLYEYAKQAAGGTTLNDVYNLCPLADIIPAFLCGAVIQESRQCIHSDVR
jgi:hypothetical protein